MSTEVRKGSDAVETALVAAHNARQLAAVSTNFHADVTQTVAGATLSVTAANASDLATSLVLVANIKGVYNHHVRDGVVPGNGGCGAHKAPGAAVTTADATDLATGITLANAIKTAYGVHIASTALHYTADATNTIAAANASDQGTLNTLLNELKTDLNAHIASGPAGSMIKLVDP